jgi:hypothetical protein
MVLEIGTRLTLKGVFDWIGDTSKLLGEKRMFHVLIWVIDYSRVYICQNMLNCTIKLYVFILDSLSFKEIITQLGASDSHL